jgi:hypothetical protein
METKRHSVNLKQYRKVNGKWQFVPVARDAKGAPDPRLVVIDGVPTSSKGGTFYLEFKHHGKRRQESIGTVPREALEAWRTKCAVLTGLIEPEEEPEVVERGLTIEQAIEKYLVEVQATKGVKTFRQYRNELEWFRKHSKKRYVSQLNRSDAMALFAQGRKELVDGRPLNQKTIIHDGEVGIHHGLRNAWPVRGLGLVQCVLDARHTVRSNNRYKVLCAAVDESLKRVADTGDGTVVELHHCVCESDKHKKV